MLRQRIARVLMASMSKYNRAGDVRGDVLGARVALSVGRYQVACSMTRIRLTQVRGEPLRLTTWGRLI